MSRATARKSRTEIEEPDRLEGFSAPREVDGLIGHHAARSEFKEALNSGRLHHAWLLVGPEGVGKATFAYHLAREMLALGDDARGHLPPVSTIASENPVFRKVAARSHPNLLLLRRSWVEKTKRYSQWIGVDEVRRLRAFLGHSAGEGGWRVVIVDRADDLNQNAANALLKALEEPPQKTLFLLVAAAEGQIPVTIRSRCRTLRVTALPAEDLERAVRAALARDDHDIEAETLLTALELSQGSVRRALELATGDGIALYRDIVAALGKLPELDGPALHKLAERLGGAADSERFELFFSLLLGLLERLIRIGATGEDGIGAEGKLASRFLDRSNLSPWVEVWEAIGLAKTDVTSLNLDRSVLVLETFLRLQRVARANPV
ncbi:MAG: DNA polymerase III subunit delta' [Methyloceanibacter sp.]